MALVTDRIGLEVSNLTGDLVMTNGRLVWTTGLGAIVQGVRVRLQFFKGEWFSDLDLGTPWYQDILGQKPNTPRIRSIIAQRILDTPGVIAVEKMELEYTGVTRTLTVNWIAKTEFGDTPEESTVIA